MAAPSGAVFICMTKTPALIKDIDYIINQDGDLVFTASYLLKRGHCCQSGCLNCPYGYKDRVDPNVPAEFNDSWGDSCSYDDEDENDD